MGNCLCGPKTPSTRVEPTTDQATLPCPNVSPPAENRKLVPLAEQEDIMLPHFHGPATLQVEGNPSSATDGSSLQITDWRSPSSFVNHIVKSESSSVISHTSSVATDNSRPEYCLIVGPFGREYSYKGYLPTIRKVVVSKHLGFDGVPLYHGPQRRRQFEVQMATLKKPGHPDLVKLIGVYFAEGHTVPLFELMPIGFYESYLHDYPQLQQELDWNTRVNIAVAAAKGLQSMHSEMICGDLRVMACDIFSFGMFLLELLTGLKPVKDKSSGLENLVDWAKDMLINNTNPVYMVDPFLFGDYPPEELHQIINLAQQCAQEDPSRQPALSELFGVLEEMSMNKDGFVYLSKSAFSSQTDDILASSGLSQNSDLVHESSMDGQPTKDGSEKSSDEDWEHLA